MAEPIKTPVHAPELLVAAKKITQLEADLANVRRSMVQVLTSSTQLFKAVWALDDDYFGGRFQADGQAERRATPKDFSIAAQVVAAVSEELTGNAAFADSPLLRDAVGTLTQALASLRKQALELDRIAGEAVGLPTRGETFAARTFPENNPLACLTETSGFIRDLEGITTRVRDRIGALRMMLKEAEGAVSQVNAEEVAGQVTAELKAKEVELAAITQQSQQLQEEQREESQRWQRELAEAREEVARESDMRQGDWAEARSLAAEILRLVEADGAQVDDDLEITLGVLRDSLQHPGIEGMMGAAEQAVVAWAKVMTARANSAGSSLAKAQGDVAGPAAEIARLTAELATARQALEQERLATREAQARLQAEGRILQGRLQDAETRVARLPQLEAAAAQVPILTQRCTAAETARTKAEAAQRQADERVETLSAKLTAAETAAAEVGRLRTTLAEVQSGQATRSQGDLEALRKDLTSARAEAEALRPLKERAAALERDLAALRSRADQAQDARRSTDQDLAKRNDELAAIQRERDAARASAEAAATAQKSADARVVEGQAKTAQALAETDRLRAEHARSEAERLRLAEELATLRRDSTEARQRLDEARKATGVGERRTGELEQQLAAAAAGERQARADLAKIATEAASAAQGLTAIKAEAAKAREAVVHGEADLSALRLESNHIKEQLAASQARDTTLAGELVQVRDQLGKLQSQHRQSEAQKAAWQEMETTLIADRDTARKQGNEHALERDRLRASLDRVSTERAELARRLEETNSQLTVRITETSRQLGELKVVNARLIAENERFEKEAKERLAAAHDERKVTEGNLTRRLTEVGARAEDYQRQLDLAATQLKAAQDKAQELDRRLAVRAEAEKGLNARLADADRAANSLKTDLNHLRAADAERRALLGRVKDLEASVERDRRRHDEAESAWKAQYQELRLLLVESREGVLKTKHAMERLMEDQQTEMNAVRATLPKEA